MTNDINGNGIRRSLGRINKGGNIGLILENNLPAIKTTEVPNITALKRSQEYYYISRLPALVIRRQGIVRGILNYFHSEMKPFFYSPSQAIRLN